MSKCNTVQLTGLFVIRDRSQTNLGLLQLRSPWRKTAWETNVGEIQQMDRRNTGKQIRRVLWARLGRPTGPTSGASCSPFKTLFCSTRQCARAENYCIYFLHLPHEIATRHSSGAPIAHMQSFVRLHEPRERSSLLRNKHTHISQPV